MTKIVIFEQSNPILGTKFDFREEIIPIRGIDGQSGNDGSGGAHAKQLGQQGTVDAEEPEACPYPQCEEKQIAQKQRDRKKEQKPAAKAQKNGKKSDSDQRRTALHKTTSACRIL